MITQMPSQMITKIYKQHNTKHNVHSFLLHIDSIDVFEFDEKNKFEI